MSWWNPHWCLLEEFLPRQSLGFLEIILKGFHGFLGSQIPSTRACCFPDKIL